MSLLLVYRSVRARAARCPGVGVSGMATGALDVDEKMPAAYSSRSTVCVARYPITVRVAREQSCQLACEKSIVLAAHGSAPVGAPESAAWTLSFEILFSMLRQSDARAVREWKMTAKFRRYLVHCRGRTDHEQIADVRDDYARRPLVAFVRVAYENASVDL